MKSEHGHAREHHHHALAANQPVMGREPRALLLHPTSFLQWLWNKRPIPSAG